MENEFQKNALPEQKKYWEENIHEYWKLPEETLRKITEKIPEGAKVLDLGCGDGELLKQLQESGKSYNLTGADISEKVVDVARKNIPDAKYITLDITEEDIPEKFDVIFMKFVLGCLKNEKYISQEELCNSVLEKIAESCEQLVLINPVLKEGVDQDKVKKIFVDKRILIGLMKKHFNKIVLLENDEGKREFNYETYLLSDKK
jgi:SAM-dependent methyltransferase